MSATVELIFAKFTELETLVAALIAENTDLRSRLNAISAAVCFPVVAAAPEAETVVVHETVVAPEPVVAPEVSAEPEVVIEKFPFRSEAWLGRFVSNSTSRVHLNKLADISQWRAWAAEPSIAAGQQLSRYRYINAWSAFTSELTLDDVAFAQTEIKRLGDAISGGVIRATLKTDDVQVAMFHRVKEYIARVKSGQIPVTIYNVFGAILAPRRCEVASLVIFDTDAEANTFDSNSYARETATLRWKKYKTDSSYGVQVVCLRDPCLVNSPEDRERAVLFLNSLPLGPVFPASQAVFSKYANRSTKGLTPNCFRHYFSSLFANSPRETRLRCCFLLAHSPATSLVQYVVDV